MEAAAVIKSIKTNVQRDSTTHPKEFIANNEMSMIKTDDP